MKKLSLLFSAIFILICVVNLHAQENTQLCFCLEETVKADKIGDYQQVRKNLVEQCRQRRFPFPVYTWKSDDLTFKTWAPVHSLNEMRLLEAEIKRMTEKTGVDLSDVSTQTKKDTFRIRNDLSYRPLDPDYGSNEFGYISCTHIRLKAGKQATFEQALLQLNEARKKYDLGCYLFCASKGAGIQNPYYILMAVHPSEEEFLKTREQIGSVMKKDMESFFEKINPILEKPIKVTEWNLIEELTYLPRVTPGILD